MIPIIKERAGKYKVWERKTKSKFSPLNYRDFHLPRGILLLFFS